MTATMPCTEAVTCHFEGEGTVSGVKVHIEADASAIHAEVTVLAEADAFPNLPDDSWYDPVLQDAQGNELRARQCGATDPRTLKSSFDWTGILPDQLSLTIRLSSESNPPTVLAGPIPLTMTDRPD